MLFDELSRPLKDLRISVTDRCNFRCAYCMPHEKYDWLEKRNILSFEEITRLANIFVKLGVEKIRLTGGEPLLRRDLEELVGRLSGLPGLKDLCLTTNGSLLAGKARALASAGLKRVNVSIDSLDREVFKSISRRYVLEDVLEGLFAARRAGLNPVKINTVVVRGLNDRGLIKLVEFARCNAFPLRFIEYMDAGNANGWKAENFFSRREMVEMISTRFPLEEIGRENGSSPAVSFRFKDGVGDFGVIASVSAPFCSSCSRARLTADGRFVTCLFSNGGCDLKGLMRGGARDDEIEDLIRSVWAHRKDRYSEQRLDILPACPGSVKGASGKMEMIRLGG